MAVFLMNIDVIFYTIEIYNYSQWIAFLTGLIFGVATINFIFLSIDNLLAEIKKENY